LEDNEQDRELVAKTLAADGLVCRINYAKTKAEFQAALAQRDIDLIICDYTLPSYSGTEALAEAREKQPDTPFIFVSGTIGEERAVASLRSGATDYVLKDRLNRLNPVVHRALHEAELQRQQSQAYEAMCASEHKYRQVFESLGDAVLLIRADTGKIIDANPQAEALLGRSRGQILGLAEGQLYRPPEDGSTSACHSVAFACQSRGGCEALVLRQDGAEIPVQIWASRLELHGRWFFLALFRDLTERKQLERQFLRVQRLESIGTLASGVAHDLKNILAPILMAGPMLSEEVRSATGRALLATLDTCARRGTDVVQQLTTFACGWEGRKGPVQPRHLLREVGKIVSETFPKAIVLNYQVPAGLWMVLGVPTQIHQVLLNLVVNARDAMPEGGRLSMAAENVRLEEAAANVMPGAKAGLYVLLRIADTGTGIAPEIADRIFDPFFSTKGADMGTGLGLSTVVGIVRSHGGFIQFTSPPGRGTEFRVYLPAFAGHAATPAASAPQAYPRGRGELVLIVDDEVALCSVMQRVLEKHGYRTVTAHNGAQALALYANRGQEIALVITDLDMPCLGGLATADALLSMNPGLKIVVSTGLDLISGGRAAVPVGCRAVLKKPCEPGLLLQTMDQVLRGERPLREELL
jgi:PAS domain S-box-containing protein